MFMKQKPLSQKLENLGRLQQETKSLQTWNLPKDLNRLGKLREKDGKMKVLSKMYLKLNEIQI